MVICAVDGRIVGLIVDEVTEVATFERDEIQPAPYFMADPDTEFFPGVCRYKGKLLLLVNLRQILGSDRQIDAVQIQEQALGTAVKD
jgi:purine-binding chemotaxis protein CheW